VRLVKFNLFGNARFSWNVLTSSLWKTFYFSRDLYLEGEFAIPFSCLTHSNQSIIACLINVFLER